MNSCSLCRGNKRRVSQNGRMFPVHRRLFHVLRDNVGSARTAPPVGARAELRLVQIAKLTFRARSLGGGAAWVSLGRCCILAAVLPREGVARIFIPHGRTARPRNDLLQLGQTRFWKAAKAVMKDRVC